MRRCNGSTHPKQLWKSYFGKKKRLDSANTTSSNYVLGSGTLLSFWRKMKNYSLSYFVIYNAFQNTACEHRFPLNICQPREDILNFDICWLQCYFRESGGVEDGGVVVERERHLLKCTSILRRCWTGLFWPPLGELGCYSSPQHCSGGILALICV